MRAVIQRVSNAEVRVGKRTTGSIGRGLVVLVGVSQSDTDEDIEYLANKTVNMRLFPDPSNAARGFELSATEVGAGILLVSQFTLYASTRKGRRPGFTDAAPPDVAEPLFEKVVHAFRQTGLRVETGEFGASMSLELTNEGPVTIALDTADRSKPRRG